jgi:subtilase family serine protease
MPLASWLQAVTSRSPRRRRKAAGSLRRKRRTRPALERLEERDVPSAGPLLAAPAAVKLVTFAGHGGHAAAPAAGRGPGGGYSPDQIRTAYNFYGLPGLNTDAAYNPTAGAGQTIAIVDAYNDPAIAADLAAFDRRFNLPGTDTTGGAAKDAGSVYNFFSQVNQAGGSSLPANDAGWATEIALDVEWAHAMAPAARVVLVEASSANVSDLVQAVQYAAGQAQVVSMSWVVSEFSGETGFDYNFNKPGVTFVASAGDNGAPPAWPAVSPYVLAVGGTSLKLTSASTLQSETGWDSGGGGVSKYEKQPGYQAGAWNSTFRTSPDVAYDADPNTGVSVYDSYGSGGWAVVGGTSAGAPQWSALVALADQARGTPLSSSQTLAEFYGLSGTSAFNDVTSGNNGFAAGVGYDLVTGLGSPNAARIVSALKTS